MTVDCGLAPYPWLEFHTVSSLWNIQKLITKLTLCLAVTTTLARSLPGYVCALFPGS